MQNTFATVLVAAATLITTFASDCSLAYCTSPRMHPRTPSEFDCWAGSEKEGCTCSDGRGAVETGTTKTYQGTLYHKYTCCKDQGTTDGECGDFKPDNGLSFAYIIGAIMFAICCFCCFVAATKYCCKITTGCCECCIRNMSTTICCPRKTFVKDVQAASQEPGSTLMNQVPTSTGRALIVGATRSFGTADQMPMKPGPGAMVDSPPPYPTGGPAPLCASAALIGSGPSFDTVEPVALQIAQMSTSPQPAATFSPTAITTTQSMTSEGVPAYTQFNRFENTHSHVEYQVTGEGEC